ncbi:ARP4 [Sanghuangporus weigelae]
MVNYGGDEVSALVLDIGTSSIRAGYAGDDAPKAIIPTSFGYTEDDTEDVNEEADVSMTDANKEGDSTAGDASVGANAPSSSKKVKLYIGQHGPSLFRPNMQVGNPISNGLIEDFAPIPALVRNVLEDNLRCNPAEHPILVTEQAWNTVDRRERMAEIMFEEFQAPAFYIANTGVLNAFAAGKGTALVIDIGHSEASVTPVVDGFVLRKGLAHSSLPQFVRAHAKHTLSTPTQSRQAIQLLPHQLIANKRPVADTAQPIFTLHEDRVAAVTPTWRQWYEDHEVDEWIMSVAAVVDQGWNEQLVAQRPQRPYEFPTGYNQWFGVERFMVGEQYFTHAPGLVQSNPNIPKTIPNLIAQSLSASDPDLRAVLLSNIVLCGGGSLLAGLGDRLHNELARNFPHMKIHAPGNPTERRYGGWLGGSILASLGTFHQLWISREEWQEHGRSIVAQRCK